MYEHCFLISTRVALVHMSWLYFEFFFGIEFLICAKERRRRILYFTQNEEEELQSPMKAGVNRVFVCKTSMTAPNGNNVRCITTSPFAGSRHYAASTLNMVFYVTMIAFWMTITINK